MSKIIDNWFSQEDIKNKIENHTSFSDEYTPIFEEIDNALEHFIYYSIPIPVNKIGPIMNHETWGIDDRITRKKVLCLRGQHYLSISFRRYFELSFWHKNYYTSSNIIYGKKEKEESRWLKSQKCFVLSSALTEYLKATKQMLVYGIRSHRYSERKLDEFQLELLGEKYKTDRTNFSFYIQEIKERNSINHSRLKSMSILFGKYFVQPD